MTRDILKIIDDPRFRRMIIAGNEVSLRVIQTAETADDFCDAFCIAEDISFCFP